MKLNNLEHYEEFFICAYCAYCVNNNAACPTFLSVRHEIVTGRGKMITARNLAQGLLNKEEGLEALKDGLFQCTFCGACEQECMVDIPLTEVYTELKGLMQDRLPENTVKIFQNLESKFNIYGMDQADRNFWNFDVEDTYDELVNRSAEVGYFIGCMASYMGRASGAPVAILKLVTHANEKISIFSPTENCCGNPFLLGGCLEKAKKLAQHNVNEIEKLGIKTLFVSCAGCYRVIKEEYPKLLGIELPFKVFTHMEYLLNLIKEKKLKLLSLTNIKVSFKDPCELGRHCGEYEIARDLISSLPGIESVELANNRENALCCGAGGLVKANYPELAEDIALRLIQQMEEAGTELCLNACPSCLLNIDQFLRQQQSSILAIDIAQLVHRLSQNYQNSLIVNQ
ncbi:MAG: (Fe-S)-binding protein [Candidatus Heimdallarchaeota archaeon]|nr:MAG: (Fe-S)-binding protein [Candidatus Heimdallarchaeota archaeon]